ncbi:MAG: hypothetical protein AAF441_17345 [Pseudomonadota bacterium]
MLKYELPPPDIGEHSVPELDNPGSRPKLIFNWEDWLPYLEEIEGTEAQKRELLETLWQIVSVFADIGWEIGADVDKSSESMDLSAELKRAVLYSKEHQQEEEV